jgi:protein SCO1
MKRLALLAAGLLLVDPGPARARSEAAGPTAAEMPSPLREVGFDQKLGDRLPLDLAFRDDQGRTVRLGDYFGTKPVVLNLVYFECPMLCTVSLNGLASALDLLSLTPGRDFELVTISFDATETPALAAAKKKAYLSRYKRPEAQTGWHFLTGEAASVKAVADAIGFRYAWDEETKQYAHPAGLVVATAQGDISRYLFGIEYAPKDLRLALVESAAGKIGGPIDRALLYCFEYDPARGRYGASILNLVRLAGLFTVLALGGLIFTLWRRERTGSPRPPQEAFRG